MKHFKFEIFNNKAKILEEVPEEQPDTIALNDEHSKIVLDGLASEDFVLIDPETKQISITKKDDLFDNFKSTSKKGQLALNLKKYLMDRLDGFSVIDMVIYMDAKLELADLGYVITDSNREEKYLEILETEDENLIDLLEDYLILKDKIAAIKAHKKTYNTVTEKIRTLDENSEEFEIIFNKYS